MRKRDHTGAITVVAPNMVSSLFWLPLLRQPTLVMAGSDDPIVPLFNAKVLAKLIRRARLHVVDDGHLFLATRASSTARVVSSFLGEGPRVERVVGASSEKEAAIAASEGVLAADPHSFDHLWPDQGVTPVGWPTECGGPSRTASRC
jgi:fermentation-respiration switch protein FrsA (DUF1100 family)